MKKIAIFASGSGTNAQKIMEYFLGNPIIEVALVLSNKVDAYVLTRAKDMNVPSFTFTYKELKETSIVQDKLKEFEIDFIVLAGFMLMIPSSLIEMYPNKIVNIHPALLPKFGGKGMYGDFVHQAVIEAGEKESGITIHFVNEKYDEGKIIFQAECPVDENDTPETLATKVHALEHRDYPGIIEKVILAEI
ncbi:MAG: phosphoribosylglycinamide formyltransferase [Candidatus Paceibacterota bacterium]|jgi:phosphoribosylglycinamide formyltransferase-1